MYLVTRKAQSAVTFEPPEEVQVRKRDFIWRTLVFVVLELAFLALATVCLTNPIPLLPISTPSSGLAEAKAITTAIAVAWHTVAIFPIKDIISTVFSAECIAQYRRTGHLQPNLTDRVSCITSGLLAQASHFLTLRPTLEYRLGFLLVLSTVALAPLGPSVIGLGPSSVTRHENLPIANLTMTNGFLSASQHQCVVKADEIVSLELLEGGTYSYETQQKRMLIPWPKSGLEESKSTIKYESDVVVYNYTCRWPEFRFNESRVVITEAANVSWTPWNDLSRGVGVSYDFDIMLPLLNPQDYRLPSSAFIFVNNTRDPPGPTWIHISQEDMTGASNSTINFNSELMAGVLLCDPHYSIQRAQVTLQNGQLSASLVELPPLGNFPESAANALFSQAFLRIFSPREIMANSPATIAFTMDPSNNQTLLSTPEISQNMNRVVQSAAKAYISGYTGFDGSQLGIFPSYTALDQTVTTQDQEISLVSSKPFLVAVWVLDAVIILILAFFLCTANAGEMLLFNLQTMETVYRNLPTGDDDPSPDSSPQHHHADRHDPKPNKLGFTWRMITFAILELSFLAFAGYCSTNIIPVYLPSAISPPQAKAVATAVVVAWRTLAVFPVKDILSSVFSAECIAQYRRTGSLEPNRTDKVSQATSGLMDQTSHFLAWQPTLEYRLAYLLVLLVMVIGPLGPGVVSLTESPMTLPQDFSVANMTMDGGAFFNESQLQVYQRAKTFVGLELLEGAVYGYDTVADGVLIPWPELGFEQSDNVTTYGSDVAVYNYSCHWTTAEADQTVPGAPKNIVIPGVSPNGTEWVTWSDEDIRPFSDQEAIFPLVVATPGVTTSSSPLSAFMFSGNSTLMDLNSTGASFHIIPKWLKIPSVAAMPRSILLCDPQFKIQRANVTLSSGKLRANVLPTLPLLGNFPETAANALFSQAMLATLGPGDEDPDRLLSPISMLLFTGEFNGTGPLHPFPLPVINDNMNRALKSAAKSYLSGYNTSFGSKNTTYALWSQTATVQYQQLALVASRSFFIGLVVLVAVTVAGLIVLLKVIDIGKVQLFNLQTLEKVYTGEIFARDD